MSLLNARSITLALGGALLLLTGEAQATSITTTSTTNWKSSTFITGSYSTLNFYPVGAANYNTAAGIALTPSGAATSFDFTGYDNGAYYLSGDNFNKTLSTSTDPGSYLKVAFSSATENAFLIGTNASSANQLTLTLSDGETFSMNSAILGLSVSHPISWLTLSSSGSNSLVSDFWYGVSSLPQDAPGGPAPSPTATPEPATVLMTLAGGLMLLSAARKRKIAEEFLA